MKMTREGVPYAPAYRADYSNPDAYVCADAQGREHRIVFRSWDLRWDVQRDGVVWDTCNTLKAAAEKVADEGDA